ncbi:Bax inhibitor-1 family protein [Alicyclobacillus sp. SO9]|uniref:Bax inhibitor-1/YccA family protein n=1 Tax=Alicyclobacillus sp. SO9 TaxID=2665646 RepID=UPI0018E8EB5B|nr:Bax inhibitor-1 family protein [Alicyclobacillus sp. SO9]QQE79481.1 Bax inhibitor-1 family protein [Alicyclobacillus sp. SO9]
METYSVSRQAVLPKVFSGLFLSLLTAFVGLVLGQFVPTPLLLVLMIVEVVMIIAAMLMQGRRQIGMGFVLTFTFISGMTLYLVVSQYISQLGSFIVLEAVGVSAGAFLIAAIVAAQTSLDFSFLGGFLFIGLMAVLLMGLVTLFIPFSNLANLIYALLGIAVFIGYVLFDVNRIARQGLTEAMVPWVVLSLYLDFVNLFLFVLRLMGILQSSRR